MKIEEVGIRKSFEFVLILTTYYLLLFLMSNAELRLKNEEVGILSRT